MIFFIVIFVLMMQFLWLYIDELVGKGLGFKVIAEFLGWGSATLIPMALPLSTLLASIMTLGSLGENNELLAMKAAGIPLQRILRPLIIVSVIISIGAFFASNNLIPVSYDKIYTLRDDINKTKEEIKIPVGVFYDGIDNYTLKLNERNKETGMMYDVMVYNHTGNKGNTSLTIADSGMIKLTEDKKGVIFSLYSGTSYEENDKINYRDTTLSLQKINFSFQEIVIPLENYAFERSDDSRFGNEVMAKNLSQLKKDKDSLGTLCGNITDDYKRKILSSLELKHDDELDSIKGKNLKAVFDTRFLYDSLSNANKMNAASMAISKMASTKNMLSSYSGELKYPSYILRKTKVESFRKFTLSIACFIFFFIGAPLGAIIRKGGLGTPMIISVLFFVFYWVVDISGIKLAKDGAASPFIGTFISSMVLFPIGVFLTYKAAKDSALFSDVFVTKVKKYYGKAVEFIFKALPFLKKLKGKKTPK